MSLLISGYTSQRTFLSDQGLNFAIEVLFHGLLARSDYPTSIVYTSVLVLDFKSGLHVCRLYSFRLLLSSQKLNEAL